MQLKFTGGTYNVTPEDRLWLLRAVEAEGPPAAGVAVALVNGFAWATGNHRWVKPLADWVRAYAQPVNPRWYPDGDLYQLSLGGMSEAQQRAALQRARARESKHSTRTEFSAATVAAVNHALSTNVAHDITDYAAAHVDATKKGYQPRSSAAPGQNRFWTRAAGWTGYVASAAQNGIGVAIVLIGIGILWLGRRA